LKPQAYSYLRMSTDLQLKGDSRRRQLEASRAYAEANDLELAQGAELEDIGVSAFKGANAREGALGRFLDAVRSGSVRPGSYLLVESLDRLSRQELLKAQSLFLSIIQAGINLVTLVDGRVYPAGTNDLGDLILSLVIMSRAHEESQTKSHRIAAAWKSKRTDAVAKKPMTKWCPAWLRLASDRSSYEPITERVAIVKQIFTDTVSGIGIYTIAKRLNQTGVPTFDRSNGWHQSYIAKILANRSVLGEFQPHVRREGKRVPDGEAIQGYFPAVIDEELFYRAQTAKSQRKVSGAGRKGTAFSNLFSGLARCAYCRCPIVFENKGTGPKGGTYLICDGAKRRLGCASLRWRYHDFETSFLAFVEEVDFASISDGSSRAERQKLEAEVSSLDGELSTVTGLMEKTFAVLSAGGPVEFVTTKLNELAQRRREIELALQTKTQQLNDLASHQSQRLRSQQEIKSLLERLQETGDGDLYAMRARVASHLKSLIMELTVGSIGYRPREAVSPDDRTRYYVDYFMREEKHRDHRYFAVTFRDSRARIVYPRDGTPLEYVQLILVRKAGDPEYEESQELFEQAMTAAKLR
jgi:DNA invertase Pin-like site-specific DNA recombinase